ncbi:RidA family protein [Streptomyces avicenniae]|uniref:RidA family protein n=1 Tax=Streptomyces avicenniae TaxID=500153 RepID=UPI00069B110A|nr:RidA family protein [Streptomyces avicenniae]
MTAPSPRPARPSGHYTQAVVVPAGARLVHVSGQLPVTPDGQALADRPFAEQVAQVLANVDACLATVGADRSHLTKVRVYVTDIADWPAFDRAYAAWLGPDLRPARAVVGVDALHFGVRLEIEAEAALP